MQLSKNFLGLFETIKLRAEIDIRALLLIALKKTFLQNRFLKKFLDNCLS